MTNELHSLAADSSVAIYATLLSAMPGNYVLLQNDAPRFTIVSVTPQFCKVAGLKKEALVGKGVFEAFPPNPYDLQDTGAAELLASLEYVVRQKVPHTLAVQRYDLQLAGKGFAKRYWRASNNPVVSDEGEVLYIIHSTVDITAEHNAAESEDRFRVLADQAPVFVFMAKPDASVTYWNKYWLEFTGQDFEQSLGRAWENVVHPNDYQQLLNTYLTATAARQRYSVEARMLRTDGAYRYILFTGGPQYSADGILIGNIGTGVDIHDRIKAEKALQDSEERVRGIVESAPFPIGVYVGKEMRIALANKSLMEVWKKGSDVVGKLYSAVLPELANQQIFDQLDEVYKTGNAFHAKNKRVDLMVDGELQSFYFNYSFIALLDVWGKVYGVMSTSADVTDLIVAKQKVEESERNFRHLVLKAPVGICIVSGDPLMVEEVNDTFLELVGKPRKKMMTFPYWEVNDEGAPFYEPILKQVFESGIAYHASEHEIVLIRNGKEEIVYTTFVYDPIPETKGTTGKVMILALDVTHQVAARKEIEESEEKFRSLFESMDQGFCIIEMIFDDDNTPVDYRFVETNPVFEKQTGLKDAAGKTARELVPGLEARWFELYGMVALTGESIRFVEGSATMARWFDVYAFRIGNEESRKVALLFTDITERKKSEEAVKQSERNLRAIILQAPVAMCILLGPDHVVDIANEAIIHLWGKNGKDVMHKPIFEGWPEARGQGFEQMLDSVYLNGETCSVDERPVELMRGGKMETVYLNFVYEPYRNAEAKILGIVAIAIEVTEQVLARHKIEEVVVHRTTELAAAYNALKANNDELLRSNVNLEDFAYAASHDLKEPIRKIRTFSDRLKTNLQGLLPEQDLHYFQRLEKATERMQSLIDDLLEYSHVSSPTKHLADIDLHKKVLQVLEDLELEVADKNAKIIVGSLPVIRGHRRQLQQLFQNLITNSLKFNKPGTTPEIRISSTIITGKNVTSFHIPEQYASVVYTQIEISDNGIGFQQEYSDRIFKMFQRLHGKAEYEGTGIGLAIVRRVVQNHKGFIKAESRVGEGATFTILLPVE